MKRALIVLTFNEIDGVRAVLPRISREWADEVLVVDGGSTDGTIEHCRALGFKVTGQTRRGRGEAFRVGVRETTSEALVFFSPDGNEDTADIPRLFELLSGGADIAIASRFLPASRNEEDDDWLPLRKWTNQAFSWIANVLWNRGQWVTDTINGFRGIKRGAFETLKLQSMGYTIEYEMTIRAMKRRLRVEEIPTHEGNRIGGETKAPSFQTGVVFLKLLWREMVGSA